MSFGDGWHRCPGAPLALQETAVFLDCLFKIPGIRLDETPTMDWNPLVESYELRDAFVSCAS
jgi:cytochrome P450